MTYILLFMSAWNAIWATFLNRVDAMKIQNGDSIILKSKNLRAWFIFAMNVVCVVLYWIDIHFNPWLILCIALFAQVVFGIVFDTGLNFRRFGFTIKTLLYTSNDKIDLNDALLDRLTNHITNFLTKPLVKRWPNYPFHQWSGILQWSIKISAVVGLIKVIIALW